MTISPRTVFGLGIAAILGLLTGDVAPAWATPPPSDAHTVNVAPPQAPGESYDVVLLEGNGTPSAINAAGRVVGWTYTGGWGITQGAVWDGGRLVANLATNANAANAVAADGTPMGAGLDPTKGFIGSRYPLAVVPAAIAANGRGVGYFGAPNGMPVGGTFVFAGGQDVSTVTPLEPGMKYNYPQAINASGVVVGLAQADYTVQDSWAYRWDGGKPTLLPGRGAAPLDQGQALGINDSNVIVGQTGPYTPYANYIAASWHNGVLTTLGALPGTVGGANVSAATAINAAGTIVGWSSDDAGNQRAVIFRNGQVLDLNLMIDHAMASGERSAALVQSVKAGWFLQAAVALNDAGEICGFGQYGGVTHGFVLKRKVVAPANAITAAELKSALAIVKPSVVPETMRVRVRVKR